MTGATQGQLFVDPAPAPAPSSTATPATRTCELPSCGRSFVPRKPWSRFCSDNHRKEAHRATRKPAPAPPEQEALPQSPLEATLALALGAVRRGADLRTDGVLELLRTTLDAAYPPPAPPPPPAAPETSSTPIAPASRTSSAPPAPSPPAPATATRSTRAPRTRPTTTTRAAPRTRATKATAAPIALAALRRRYAKAKTKTRGLQTTAAKALGCAPSLLSMFADGKTLGAEHARKLAAFLDRNATSKPAQS